MASEPVSNTSKKYSDEKMVVIDIYEMLEKLPTNKQNYPQVCLCRVPRSLSSSNPESFIPQFVGLGPYHRFRDGLIMTDEMKLSVANRVLKVKDPLLKNNDMVQECLSNLVPEIQACYHEDVIFGYDSHTLLCSLTIDGLFLLGLLHSDPPLQGQNYSHYYHILTGRKQGIPLVNIAGVELTTDAIIGDVFMFENQIPTPVLHHLNSVIFNNHHAEIQSSDKLLGLAMQKFCQLFSPLVHSENLSNKPERHDHLLDLMYHLIAPPPEPELNFQPEPKLKPQSEPEPITKWTLIVVYLIFLGWTLLWASTYFIKIVFSLICSLFVMVRWVLNFSSGKLVNMPGLGEFIGNQIDHFHQILARRDAENPRFKPYTQIFGQIQERRRMIKLLKQRKSPNSLDETARKRIPSTLELRCVGIQVQPADGCISCLKYDEGTRLLYLPCVRLNVHSELILRNLMCYESLAKPNHLIFTRYIEFMCSLIHSAEDVKLLAAVNIIQTPLSHEDVAQLFNGIKNNSIGLTKVKKLEEEVKKVKEAYYNIKLHTRFWTWALPLFLIFCILAVVSLCVVYSIMKTYCKDDPTLKLICKSHKVGDYDWNQYFVSSM